jgi:hypothetical protein
VRTERILDLIRRLDFPRFAGSEGEQPAQDLIARELAEVGIDARRQAFPGPWCCAAEAWLTIGGESRSVQPIEELMQQTAVWGPPADLDAEGVLQPVERLTGPPASVIAVHRQPDPEAARLAGAAAQLFLFDETPEVHPYVVSVIDSTPPAYVRAEDRAWVLARAGESARIRWRTETVTHTFHNLVAELRGESDEAILLGAHLDSFPGTPGSSDDAFGCSVLVELARQCTRQRLARTLRFYWFTGEEIDRRGSQAAAEVEKGNVPRAWVLINLDSGVTWEHGEPTVVRATGEGMAQWATEAVAGLAPPPRVVERATEAADVEPFQCAGFPTLFPHSTRSVPGPYPHLPTDNPDAVDPARVERLARVAHALLAAALREDVGASARNH